MLRKTKKSLAELLLDQGIITQKQFDQAQEDQRKTGQSFRKIFFRLGIISEEDLVNFISQQLDIPKLELSNYLIDSKIVDLVPEELARRHQLVPVLKIGASLTCAMADPLNIFALDEIRLKTGLTAEPAIATETEIQRALDEHYSVRGSMEEVIQSLEGKDLGLKEGEEIEPRRLKGLSEEPPVVKLVNMIIVEALRQSASDIHIEPEEESLKIRFRIDGFLHEQKSPPKHFQSAVISRIKILASLDIAERRRPQDGRFQIKIDNRSIDMRVSCVPTLFGENVVLRLLDMGKVLLDLKQSGLTTEILQRYTKLIELPHGLILITGPTGSGKTTTLYASLSILNSPERNIITIEDPVEYHIPGIRQTQVNPKVDLTFANGLRSILRQDPDIIMVGEIRDLETAQMSIQAALTGHLVLATLHTNDAPSAVTRLLDMGIEPFLISSSLIAVMAQRLVRLFCKDCKGKGCKTCFQSGYKGRSGIYELMVLNEETRQLIANKATSDEIRQAAMRAGMIPLRQNGMMKVKQSLTSEEEVIRVTKE